jgi:molecular chaperone GrpE (heat shock protein)
MNDSNPRLPLWPFALADLFFLATAALLLRYGHRPLTGGEAGLMVLCGALGGGSLMAPFLKRNADAQHLSQAKLLSDSVHQIQKIEHLTQHIGALSLHWKEWQAQSAAAAASSKDIADRLSTEARDFAQWMQKANDTEKSHLRLEVEKLRRGEGERLQVITHILDHIFALFRAAENSQHPELAEQIGQFQNACREAARRIGLLPMAVEAGTTFDPKIHQLHDNEPAPENAVLAGMLAPGYTYQGQLLRRPLVTLKKTETTGGELF